MAMWDMYGLEALYDLTKHMQELDQWEKEKIWSVLKEEPHPQRPSGPHLSIMILRAKTNSQRRYEIYEFMSELSLYKVQELFKEDPQIIADWIRKNGHKIYSDRINNEDIKQVIF